MNLILDQIHRYGDKLHTLIPSGTTHKHGHLYENMVMNYPAASLPAVNFGRRVCRGINIEFSPFSLCSVAEEAV
jgi:hypothetical protein